MTVRITIKGNTAKGHKLTVFLPIAWLEQFGLNAPECFGERLRSTWGMVGNKPNYRSSSMTIVQTDEEEVVEKIKQEIQQGKEYLKNIIAIDREILIDL